MSKEHAVALAESWARIKRTPAETLRAGTAAYVALHWPGETLEQVIARAAAANGPVGFAVPTVDDAPVHLATEAPPSNGPVVCVCGLRVNAPGLMPLHVAGVVHRERMEARRA